ncbi:UDP-4-amino-4,6-dideoxy-N-acetyl-beta-L-altrosamine transaminase [Amylibacter sp.]|nr:UDP-4-amino-4,6-dideoxy-N-acetyl-beta-L-altrosamine transaminase [Amylibacter sp.]
MIPYGKQDILADDIEAVADVLKSDFLTQGPVVPKFEKFLSEAANSNYVTVVNSATSALHLACLALEVQPGDFIWTVPNTFVASANCALYCGASVDFVDIDPLTANLSVELLKQKLRTAALSGRLPKVVIPVHLSGESCDMAEIRKLSYEFNFKIIEDASHAIGGRYRDKPIGTCEFSDITVFSFHPVKIITSGEGGALLTNCPELDQKLKLLRSHGITRDKDLMEHPSDDGWYYEQIDLGFNYRMTDIHAALGLSQLSRIHDYVDKRHKIAKIYDLEFVESSIQLPFRNANNKSALHLYIIQVEKARHKYIFRKLREKKIGVNLHYIPVHTHPYYQKLGFKWGDFPNSEAYYSRAISLPIFPSLTQEDQRYVIDTVKLVCNGKS